MNQYKFLLAPPGFALLLALYGYTDVIGGLAVHKAMNAVPLGKAFNHALPVLEYSPNWVVGHAKIQSS